MEILKLSCASGEGLQDWLMWLEQRKRARLALRSEALV
jgi:hypothetical protein